MPLPEQWRPIDGFPDYQISNHGRVQSLKTGRPHLMKLSPNHRGYLMVSLSHGTRRMTRTVHLLVAYHFLGPRPEGMECRHVDGDKTHNSVDNLDWGTQSQNTLDQVAHGVHNMASKTHCPQNHPYDEENTRHLRDGSRECRRCRTETKRRYLARRAAERAA